ncbi:MAG: hypothetical protein ACI4UX_02255 [Clostridia bacterium]
MDEEIQRKKFIESLKVDVKEEPKEDVKEEFEDEQIIGELAEGYKSFISDLGEGFLEVVEKYNECLEIAKRNEIIEDVKLKARIKDFSSARLNTDKKILDDIFGIELVTATEEGKEFLMLFNYLAFKIIKEQKHRKRITKYIAYHCIGDLLLKQDKTENLGEKIKSIIMNAETKEYKRSKKDKDFDENQDVETVYVFPSLQQQIGEDKRFEEMLITLTKMLDCIAETRTDIDLPLIEFQFKTAEVAENAIMGPASHSTYKNTDKKNIENKLVDGKLIRGINSPWKFEGRENGLELQDFYKTLFENWPFLKDYIVKRREMNEQEDKELFSNFDRLTAAQFPFLRKYIDEYSYDESKKEENWQALKITMIKNRVGSKKPLKEDKLEKDLMINSKDGGERFDNE